MVTGLVVALGTWGGGLMGYSGIVATNAGLALLGGRAIAAGGFGVAGGATVLAATLTSISNLVLDQVHRSVGQGSDSPMVGLGSWLGSDGLH
ncbi:MAG: hypothetical protein OXE84_03270, partial [Rhodobacteraceae bacterium]|nr:hypothetical protein [Paracoccaceae bacterium]